MRKRPFVHWLDTPMAKEIANSRRHVPSGNPDPGSVFIMTKHINPAYEAENMEERRLEPYGGWRAR